MLWSVAWSQGRRTTVGVGPDSDAPFARKWWARGTTWRTTLRRTCPSLTTARWKGARSRSKHATVAPSTIQLITNLMEQSSMPDNKLKATFPTCCWSNVFRQVWIPLSSRWFTETKKEYSVAESAGRRCPTITETICASTSKLILKNFRPATLRTLSFPETKCKCFFQLQTGLYWRSTLKEMLRQGCSLARVVEKRTKTKRT